MESGFQLEDLLALMKRSLHSVKHLQFALEQMENVVDFVLTIEPLLKSSVPQLINYLDDLEQKGVLRIIQSTLDVRAKVAAAYSAEDVDQIKPVGPFGMLGALSSKEARKGLGVLMELTKAMGGLKNGGGSAAAEVPEPIA